MADAAVIEKPKLRVTSDMEKGSVVAVKTPKRTVHLHIALAEQQPFKVTFVTKDEKRVSTSVIQLGDNKSYTPDMTFQPDTTYLFRLNTTFEGDVIIDNVCGKKLSFPVVPGKEPISLMMGYDEKKSVNPYMGKPFIKVEEKISSDEENETIIYEIGRNFFETLEDGEHVVQEAVKPYWKVFIEDDRVHAVVLGAVADTSQAMTDIWQKFWDLARGLKYEIREINGRRYVVLKGWRHLRTYFIGTRYSVTNPKVAGLDPKTLKHVTTLKGLMGSNVVTVIIGSLLTTIDYFLSTDADKRDMTDLLVAVFTGIAKTLLAAFLAALLVAATLAILAAAEIVITSAVVVIGTTIVLGIIGSAILNGADATYGWTAKLQEEANETQAWIEHEYKSFKRSMALFFDLITGEAKPFSAYDSYME